MPLPILAAAAAAAGGLGLAKLLEALDPLPPPQEGEPDIYGPGEAPDAPWKADEQRSRTGKDVYVDCLPGGAPGQDANAIFARWLNREKGLPIPGNWPRLSRTQLAAQLSVAALGRTMRDVPRATAVHAEWDALAIGCMGEEAWEQFKNAPGKVIDWASDRIGNGGGGVSVGNEDNGAEIDSDGHGSVSVGGKKIASW